MSNEQQRLSAASGRVTTEAVRTAPEVAEAATGPQDAPSGLSNEAQPTLRPDLTPAADKSCL